MICEDCVHKILDIDTYPCKYCTPDNRKFEPTNKKELNIKVYWSPMNRVWRCESHLVTAHGGTQEECLKNWMAAFYGGV